MMYCGNESIANIVKKKEYTHTHIYIYIHIYLYTYMKKEEQYGSNTNEIIIQESICKTEINRSLQVYDYQTFDESQGFWSHKNPY